MNKSEKMINRLNFLSEAKGTELPGTRMMFVGFGRDSNGNSIVKLKNSRGKGFSIQTNGNLPSTHSIKTSGVKKPSDKDLKTIAQEVSAYVEKFGTEKMKG